VPAALLSLGIGIVFGSDVLGLVEISDKWSWTECGRWSRGPRGEVTGAADADAG
jgi:hypothetical protein